MHNFLREGRREREPPTRLDVGRTPVGRSRRRKSRIFSPKEAITRATDFARPPHYLPASLCSCPSRVLHHQETAAAVSFQLLLRNDMDGRTPGRYQKCLDWTEANLPGSIQRRSDAQRKKGSWTPSSVRVRPPSVSAFDHINVVGLHNLKPTKGPLAREGRERVRWGQREKRESARPRGIERRERMQLLKRVWRIQQG